MTRAVRDRILKDANGTISRSFRDPSASPPSWHSPSVVDLLPKKGEDVIIREGRRSVGFERWRDSRRLSGSSTPLPNFVTSKVSPSEAGGLTNGVAAAISERSSSSTKSDAEALPLLVDASGSLESTENAGWVHDYSGELGIFADHLLKHDVDLDLASEGRSGHQHKLGRNHKGKTSCARIFARALNCQSIEHPKPCGFCNSCVSHDMGKSRNIREVGPISNFDFESILDLLDNMVLSQLPSQHKIFVFDDCDTLSPDCWGAISKVIDRAPRLVVFILVSSNLDVLPHIIISRCQKFFFPKLKDADIIYTLQWIASKEDIEIDKDALNLIASRFDGSLRDAEMTLEQLSLVGQRISVPLVQELVILSNIVTRINTGAGFHAPLVLPASKDASRPGTLELGKRDARDGDTNGVSSQGQFLHSKSLEKGRCEIVELPATPKETKDIIIEALRVQGREKLQIHRGNRLWLLLLKEGDLGNKVRVRFLREARCPLHM
ncbi:hypothetical protein LWI28_015821 [Acer negundo]|uniref:Protein STICHEL-like 3 n=1 Tax=Acer negundo TaxID=4023 RepID=A0AAD5P3A9_ACENE|nr:hypothetical protein LWI28_015821 [Acer negundo]